MGEIIKGKFGGKDKEKAPKKEPEHQSPRGSVDIDSLLGKFAKEMVSSGIEVSLEIKMMAKAMEIESYLKKLDLPTISNEVSATAEQHWKGFTNGEDLLAAAEATTETEWKHSPRTYLELAKRLKNFRRDG